LLIVTLVAGGALGALASTWINSSNAIDIAQDQRLDGLQLETSKQGILSGQIAEMSGRTNAMTTELDTLSTETATLAADLTALSEIVTAQAALLEAQDTQIGTLTEAQTTILDDLTAAQDDVENLVETTIGLRRNLTTSAQSTTGVSENLTALEEQVTALETGLAEIVATVTMTGTASDIDEESVATESGDPSAVTAINAGSGVDLAFVRLLAYIARAKIHLLENDAASAGNAVESAIELVSGLSDSVAAEQAELLGPLADSLETAQTNLDSKPAVSAIALDLAWDSLDELLIDLSN
jgi:hypothetical protein